MDGGHIAGAPDHPHAQLDDVSAGHRNEQQEHDAHPDEGRPGQNAADAGTHAPHEHRQRHVRRKQDQRGRRQGAPRRRQMWIPDQANPQVIMNARDDGQRDTNEDQETRHPATLSDTGLHGNSERQRKSANVCRFIDMPFTIAQLKIWYERLRGAAFEGTLPAPINRGK
jgi:hypothetical protein